MNEFMQPVRPLRIVRKLSDRHITLQVFAVCVDDLQVKYLTIDGMFYEQKTISFAETFIDGEWVAIQ